MKNTKLEFNSEVHITEIDRALDLTAQVWEMNANISIDEMCEQIEAVCGVVDSTATFSDFCEATNLTSLETLN